MEEIERFLRKENQKLFLEIFMILEEINNKNGIISFSYYNNTLTVQISENDYYKIKIRR